MLNKNRYNKLIAGVLMVGFLITSGGLAIAKATSDTTTATTDPKPLSRSGDRGREYAPGFQEVLSDLINDGVITQEQVEAINQACQKKMEKNQQERIQQHQEQIQTQLDALIEKGTINSQQAAAILELIANQQQERQAEMDKIKAMTEEERQAYFEKNRPERPEPGAAKDLTDEERQEMRENLKAKRPNAFQDLIDNNTLTQEQAEAVAKVMPGFKK